MSARRRLLVKQFNAFIETGIPGLKKQGYNPTGYMQLVYANGDHYGAANVLLDAPGHTHYGFQRLHAMKRLDASVEYAASLPWFQELFSQSQLYEARTRLITHEFDLDTALTYAANHPPEWLSELDAVEDEL